LKKKEVIFIAAILIVAVLIWGAMKFFGPDQYGKITITVDGKEYGTYSLGKDQVITIDDTNTCTIEDGRAWMSDATCPDQLCMHFEPLDENGGMIVCLPNKVIIEGERAESADDPGVDVVS
jgi:hypothetical protein